MGYDNSTTYDGYDEIPSDCGCAVRGLIAIRDCHGDISGYLTPNDAELYQTGIIEPEIGYVKVYNPNDGKFVGVMTITDAENYLTFLNTFAS